MGGTDQFLVSRNIMVLAKSPYSWKALFDSRPRTVEFHDEVIFQSKFPRDQSSKINFYHVLSRVMNAMEIGKTVVLHNTDELYDSLYGLLRSTNIFLCNPS